MDVGLTSQVNDFNPGVVASGLFWTVAVPDNSVDVHPGAGTARFALSNFETRDFVGATRGNSLATGFAGTQMEPSGGLICRNEAYASSGSG